jgi:hypothetical protein
MKKVRTPFVPGGGTLGAPANQAQGWWSWLSAATSPTSPSASSSTSAPAVPTWATRYRGAGISAGSKRWDCDYDLAVDSLPVSRILNHVRTLRGEADFYPIGAVTGQLTFILLVDARGRIFALAQRGMVLLAANELDEALQRLLLLTGEELLLTPHEEELVLPYHASAHLSRNHDLCEVVAE